MTMKPTPGGPDVKAGQQPASGSYTVLLTAVAILLGLAVVGYLYSKSQQQVVVDMPAWLNPAVEDEDSPRLQPAKTEDGFASSARIAANSVLSAMVPVEQLSSALKECNQKVVFEVETLVNDKVSRNVAEEMLAAAEHHYKGYQMDQHLDEPTIQTVMGDYFFAIWPDLSAHIAAGRIKSDIRRTLEPRTNIGDGVLAYTFSLDEQELVATFHLPNWFVSLTMTSETGSPELFANIVAHSERQITKK